MDGVRIRIAYSMCGIQVRLFMIIASWSASPFEAMPDPVTDNDILVCQQAVKALKTQLTTCEDEIRASQQSVDAKIGGFKSYFADIESQQAKLDPQIADLNTKLTAKYKQEAELHADLRNEVGQNGIAFLQFRAHRQSPAELLVDRWFECDKDRLAAEVYLNGCNTKQKSVTMWNDQRVRTYKNKADVYVMRASRLSDPVMENFKEDARLDATISRMEKQVPMLHAEQKELRCPLSCQMPYCQNGQSDNGGEDVVTTIYDTSGCTSYCSRPFTNEGVRFCGSGSVYTDGAYVDCTRCAKTR